MRVSCGRPSLNLGFGSVAESDADADTGWYHDLIHIESHASCMQAIALIDPRYLHPTLARNTRSLCLISLMQQFDYHYIPFNTYVLTQCLSTRNPLNTPGSTLPLVFDGKVGR